MKSLMLLISLVLNLTYAHEYDQKKNWKIKTLYVKNFNFNGFEGTLSGPTQYRHFRITNDKDEKFVWIKGMSIEIFNEKNEKIDLRPLCHAWLVLNNDTSTREGQMLTISEGMDILDFPTGYGMKIKGKRPLEAIVMALKNDLSMKSNLTFRFDVSYLEDKPNINMHNLKSVGVNSKGPKAKIKDGKLCSDDIDKKGNATHFLVPPGHSEFSNKFKSGELFKGISTVHFIKIHLHRFGKSVELIDLTTNKKVWKGYSQLDNEGYIQKTDSYKDEQGFLFDGSHEYLVKSEYDNPTKENYDGMGTFLMYLKKDEQHNHRD